MEAGGIEPPSRDTSGQVSTCVVGLLFLDAGDAGRQAAPLSSSTGFSPAPVEHRSRASLLIGAAVP